MLYFSPTSKMLTNLNGQFIEQREALRQRFATAQPFPHIVLDNFLNEDLCQRLSDEFPAARDRQIRYLYNRETELLRIANRFIRSPLIKAWARLKKLRP